MPGAHLGGGPALTQSWQGSVYGGNPTPFAPVNVPTQGAPPGNNHGAPASIPPQPQTATGSSSYSSYGAYQQAGYGPTTFAPATSYESTAGTEAHGPTGEPTPYFAQESTRFTRSPPPLDPGQSHSRARRDQSATFYAPAAAPSDPADQDHQRYATFVVAWRTFQNTHPQHRDPAPSFQQYRQMLAMQKSRRTAGSAP